MKNRLIIAEDIVILSLEPVLVHEVIIADRTILLVGRNKLRCADDDRDVITHGKALCLHLCFTELLAVRYGHFFREDVQVSLLYRPFHT